MPRMGRAAIPFNVQLASDWTFFGLTAAYKVAKEDQCFDLAFHGNNAFSYNDVYAMPVYKRVYFIKKLNDHFKKQNKAQEKANKTSQSKSSPARPPRF